MKPSDTSLEKTRNFCRDLHMKIGDEPTNEDVDRELALLLDHERQDAAIKALQKILDGNPDPIHGFTIEGDIIAAIAKLEAER